MINDKHLFENINTDDDPRFLKPTEFLNLENFRIGVYGQGKNYRLENIPSPILKYFYYPTGTNQCIGRAVDYGRLRLIWFNKNSNDDDGIYAYDIQLDTTYIVLLSSQTVEGFNFSTSNRISRNAVIAGDLLIWTDNNNEPQCINIEAGIKLNQSFYVTDTDPYGANIPYTTLTLIKRPPIYRLQVEKIVDSGFDANFIAQQAYQFYYRYQYKNYQYSALSSSSQLIPYNYATDTFNAVNIKLPFNENIPGYVQQVDIIVAYGNTGKKFIIQSYNKDNFYDRIAIQDHNDNVTQLGFTFYDNIVGIALDDITANTSFDNVALKCKTLELARNRLFLGNLLKGYDAPTTTSLQLTLGEFNTGGGGSFTANWKYFYLTAQSNTSSSTTTQQFFYAYDAALNPSAYYFSAYQSAIPPAAVNSTSATTSWATETQLAAWVQRNISPPVGYHWVDAPYVFFDTGATTNLVFIVQLNGLQFFKSSSIYTASIVFYDRFKRKCGYVNRPVQITIPDRTFDQSVFATTINWSLSNTDAVDEIPDWAYYYNVSISLNLTTRFFEQIWIIDTNYAVKNQDETYTYGTTYTSQGTYATAFNLTPLFDKGLGYTFNEGDFIRIYFDDDTNIELPVLVTDGNYVLVKPTDIGTLGTGVSFLVELYTPYKKSATEPLYETGDILPIINPTLNSRQYSATSGSLNGDAYAIERDKGSSGTELYFVEAMSPNDKVWFIWQVDRGWPDFVDTIGQQQKSFTIDFSDTYVSGTKTNGLNKFEPLNTKDIGSDSGAITKLQLTNKQHQEDGNIMLIIAQATPLSMYLSETQVVASAENAFLAQSTGVIGTINSLKNSYGSIHNESIVEYNGTVWWFDAIHGVWAQYAQDGVVPISDYKLQSFADIFSKRYIEQGAEVIEDLCGFSYIESCVDPSTREAMWTIPQTEENTVTSGIPVGYALPLPSYSTLPSYASSIQNRFAFYDGNPKTIIFKYEKNTWVGAYQFLPDCMEYVGNKLYSWKDGLLYLHNENTTSFNNFYGVQYPQRICFVANAQNTSFIKDVLDIAIQGIDKPNFSVCYADYPNEQITDLTSDNYNDLEGLQYATWFRDRLDPNFAGSVIDKLYGGVNIKTAVPFIMIEFQIYDSNLVVNFINIGIEISRGNQQIDSFK